jgi:hypothetical protein
MGFRTYDQPNFVIQLNLPSSEFPYNVEMGRERSWGQLNDYLTQQYGLTPEECERVWDEYRGTICKNAKLPSLNENEDKQQKVLDYALQDLTDNTLLDWGNNPNDTYQIIQFPFSIYPKEGSTILDWIMIDKHRKLDISQFYKQFKPYAKLMYGLMDLEIVNMFPDWEDNIIEKIRDHSETEPPDDLYHNRYIGESKNIISESNIEKLINRLYQEIKEHISVDTEGITLDFPYFRFREVQGGIPTITYDPFRRDINYFDHNFVFGELERFVAYHLHKTLDIGDKLQFRNYDPMVKPIVEKLIKDIYIDAINQSFVKPNQVGEKKYNLSETIMDDIPLEQFKKDNPEVVEILNRFPEPLQRELAVERKNPKEFVEEHGNWYIRDKDQPLITMEVKNILDDKETKAIVSRTPQDVVDAINKQWGTNFVGGEVYDPNPDRYFKYANFPAETADPSVMVNYDILYGVGRLVAALIRGDKTIKVWDIVDKKENLSESVDWSDKGDNKYHRNGMVNRVVGDFLKMIELTHQSVIFHMSQHVESPYRPNYNDPYLTYIYDENGLTKDSIDLLYEGLTNGVQWYMEKTGLIDYYPPHSTNNTRPPEDEELIKMIVDTLYPIVIKGVTDYNEDEGWTMDNLYDGKFLAESTDKQEKYINHTIKHLMDNTEWADASYNQLLLNDVISISSYVNYGDFMFNFIPESVREILEGFGLTNQETDEVWDFYSRWVLEKVMREGTVNWPNKETHKKRYPFLTESKDNTTKFAEKIAKEIIDSSTLSGKLLYFYPPVVEEAKDEGPISADVNSDWIHNDKSTGVFHLTTDIRRIGRLYIKKIMGPGIDRYDPIFKQVNDIVVDNILQRARNHDWMKEVEGMSALRDKHGFLRESTQPKYLDKIFNSIIKEIRFDDDKYGAVVIPFLSKERYSSTTGGLETQEYTLSKHDRNITLRDDGQLHQQFKSYIEEIYGLVEDESNEVFERVRQYIKDELYYRSVLQQILISVQDDYIQGYGAMIDVTSERTIDLKNYDDFKEYLDWWHGIVEPDDGDGSAEITDNMVKRLYDEIWGILNDSETLMTESTQPNYLKKLSKAILDSVKTTDKGYIFQDLEYINRINDEGNEIAPYMLEKNGINIHVKPTNLLFELFRDKYSDLFGLDNSEIKELYNMVIDEILRVHRLNNLNEIIIGDFDLDHIPSLIIDDDHLDVEYNLRKYEDYYKLIQDMGYGEDYDPHYNGVRYHFNEMGYNDFRPYHEDLLEYLGHHFDFTAA